MKNLFARQLTNTEKKVQVAREILTTIERVAEIGDKSTVSQLWDILSTLSETQKDVEA